MPVHDVYMNPVCARGNHAGSGGFEVENIGSEDGRGYNHGLTLRVVDWIQFIMQMRILEYLERRGGNRVRNRGGAGEEVALQQVNA